MAKESRTRREVVEALKDLHGFAVENPIHPGTPDVCCVLGWIEIKRIEGWPKRSRTVVRVPHFSPQQRMWHGDHHLAGGASWLLLVVGSGPNRDIILLDGMMAAATLGITADEVEIRTQNLLPLATQYVKDRGRIRISHLGSAIRFLAMHAKEALGNRLS